MATVNVTVTATKIDINSITDGPATWAEVVSAVNTATAGTITGSGTSDDPHIITTPSGYRELEFTSGEVQIPADTFIEWGTITTSSQYAIDLQTNAILTVAEGCSIDMSDYGTIAVYCAFRGGLNFQGTALKPIKLRGTYRNYCYFTSGEWTMEYVDFESFRSSYVLYLVGYSGLEHLMVCTFKNCTFTNPFDSTKISWGLSRNGTFAEIKFEDCTFEDHIHGFLAYSGAIEFKNCTFKNGNNHCLYFPGGGKSVGLDHTIYNEPANTPKGSLQPYLVVDGCNFENINSGDNGVYAGYVTQVLLTGCTFDTGYRGIYSAQNSRVMINGNTFTGLTIDKGWSSEGTFIYVWEIDITVEDEAGNPIEGASVSLVQSEGKEHHSGFTNTLGQLRTLNERVPVLGEKEEYSFGSFDQWSDSIAAGRHHRIVASKGGYKTETVDIEMTEDRTLTITLLRDFAKIPFS